MNEHAKMGKRIAALRRRQIKLQEQQAQFERDRLALFDEARNLDEPFTFMEIAKIMGVTEAGVANLIKRNAARAAS